MITYEVAPWVEYEIRDSNFVAKGEGWEHVPAWGIAFEGDTKRLSIRPVISAWQQAGCRDCATQDLRSLEE